MIDFLKSGTVLTAKTIEVARKMHAKRKRYGADFLIFYQLSVRNDGTGKPAVLNKYPSVLG